MVEYSIVLRRIARSRARHHQVSWAVRRERERGEREERRERERKIEKERKRERESNRERSLTPHRISDESAPLGAKGAGGDRYQPAIHVYIYIYIHIERERDR